MDNVRYWVWLQSVMGIAANVENVVEAFGSPRAVYEATNDELKLSDCFDKIRLERALHKGLDKADKIIEECEKCNCHILTPDMPEYPEKLKMIANYPLVLYIKGDMSTLENDRIHVGVIGTRTPSQYGLDVAKSITLSLVDNNAIVVSGGALGIDSCAHSTTIEAGGKTVSILGCGLEYPYLKGNIELKRRIKETGALVSEYPPSTPPMKASFVMRNRITAALCNGVLVVEAGENSGSLNTANYVMKFNRDLFVVAGDARGNNFLGANELVKKGARVVFSGADIVSLYRREIIDRDSFNLSLYQTEVFKGSDVFPLGQREEKPKKKSNKKTEKKKTEPVKIVAEEKKEKVEVNVDDLSEEALAIYRALEKSDLLVDEIAQEAQMQIRVVLIGLSELELLGAVECGKDNKYTLNNR